MINKLFHLTLSQGRSDTLTLYSDSKNNLIDFFNFVSTAVLRNIKQIVYSKDYNINYSNSVSNDSIPVYSKVVVVALSKNYADTITLHHIKKTMTEDDIKTSLSKLLIRNEPIIDFLDIQFYDEGDSPLVITNLYQVQYKRNSKTHTQDIYAENWNVVKDVAEKLIGGEITEIRKFIHYDDTVKIDDSSRYYKRVSVNVSTNDASYSFSLPKVKKTVSVNELKQFIKHNINLRGKKIDSEYINLTFR